MVSFTIKMNVKKSGEVQHTVYFSVQPDATVIRSRKYHKSQPVLTVLS